MSAVSTMRDVVVGEAPARRRFDSYFPSDLIVRIVQHIQSYGQIRDEGRALSARLIATKTVYDLPAAKAIENKLKASADASDALLAEAKAGTPSEALKDLTVELRETLLDVRSVL